MTFKSRSVQPKDKGFRVAGDLTIRGDLGIGEVKPPNGRPNPGSP
jgi:hypothetical protein